MVILYEVLSEPQKQIAQSRFIMAITVYSATVACGLVVEGQMIQWQVYIPHRLNSLELSGHILKH